MTIEVSLSILQVLPRDGVKCYDETACSRRTSTAVAILPFVSMFELGLEQLRQSHAFIPVHATPPSSKTLSHPALPDRSCRAPENAKGAFDRRETWEGRPQLGGGALQSWGGPAA